ncbi:MAG: hypothetical protein KKA07_11000 [Bacteroidetes bacterium]|nr:hypothetical protein [Bacteroidota bacterium]
MAVFSGKNAQVGLTMDISTTVYSYSPSDDKQLVRISAQIADEVVEVTDYSGYQSVGNWWYPGWPSSITTRRTRSLEEVTNPPNDPEPFIAQTDFQYYNNGLINIKTDFANLPIPVVSVYEYDNFGNPKQVTVSAIGEENRTSKSTFDQRGRFVISTENALGHKSFFEYDHFTALLKKQKDPNGLITKYKYDGFGRITETELPISAGHIVAVDRQFCPSGDDYLFKSIITEPGKPALTEYYDQLGRKCRSESYGLGNRKIVSDVDYDENGRLWHKYMPYFENEQDEDLKTTYSYDEYGRVASLYSPASSTEFAYIDLDHIVAETTTYIENSVPKSRTSTEEVNSSGLTTKITDPANNIMEYFYNSMDKPYKILAQGIETTIFYDDYGNQRRLTDPSAGVISYIYNPYGELESQTSPSGTTSMEYDLLGRITSKTEPEGTTTYQYDNQQYAKGLVTKITGYEGYTTEMKYNRLGQPETVTEKIDDNTFTSKFGYNSHGALVRSEYPSGFAVINEYDQNGYLTTISRADNQGTIWQANQSNALGQLTSYSLGNNLETQKSYTPLGLLSRIQTGSIQDFYYDFSPGSGNLLARQDNIRYLREEFEFDDLNQLTGIYNGQSELLMGMSYEKGNITSKSDVGHYDYGQTPYAVTEVDSDPYTSTFGAPLSAQQDISYNTAGRPSVITQADMTYMFYYGPDNQRRKTVNIPGSGLDPVTTYYLGAYEQEESGTEVRKLHYIAGGDGIAALFVTDNAHPAGQMYYLHTDHLGSITHITNETAQLVQERSFDAWGRHRNPAIWSYENLAPLAITNRGYTGHEHLDAFHLINANARLYDPVCARFLSPDNFVQSPANSTGFNRYAYCMNNPVVNVDPSGEVPFLIPVAIGMVAGYYLGSSMYMNNYEIYKKSWWQGQGNSWKAGVAGAIVGGGAGIAFSAAFGSSIGITMMSPGVAPGLAESGATTMLWNIFSNAFITGSVNVLNSGFQTGWNSDVMFKSGLVGLAAGGIGGAIASNKKFALASNRGAISTKGIKVQNYVTNILSGAGDRYFRTEDSDYALKNAFWGGAEGAFAAWMFSTEKMLNVGRGMNVFNNPIFGRYYSGFLSNNITANPGASLMAARIYATVYPFYKLGAMNMDACLGISTGVGFGSFWFLALSAIQSSSVGPQYPYAYGFLDPDFNK